MASPSPDASGKSTVSLPTSTFAVVIVSTVVLTVVVVAATLALFLRIRKRRNLPVSSLDGSKSALPERESLLGTPAGLNPRWLTASGNWSSRTAARANGPAEGLASGPPSSAVASSPFHEPQSSSVGYSMLASQPIIQPRKDSLPYVDSEGSSVVSAPSNALDYSALSQVSRQSRPSTASSSLPSRSPLSVWPPPPMSASAPAASSLGLALDNRRQTDFLADAPRYQPVQNASELPQGLPGSRIPPIRPPPIRTIPNPPATAGPPRSAPRLDAASPPLADSPFAKSPSRFLLRPIGPPPQSPLPPIPDDSEEPRNRELSPVQPSSNGAPFSIFSSLERLFDRRRHAPTPEPESVPDVYYQVNNPAANANALVTIHPINVSTTGPAKRMYPPRNSSIGKTLEDSDDSAQLAPPDAPALPPGSLNPTAGSLSDSASASSSNSSPGAGTNLSPKDSPTTSQIPSATTTTTATTTANPDPLRRAKDSSLYDSYPLDAVPRSSSYEEAQRIRQQIADITALVEKMEKRKTNPVGRGDQPRPKLLLSLEENDAEAPTTTDSTTSTASTVSGRAGTKATKSNGKPLKSALRKKPIPPEPRTPSSARDTAPWTRDTPTSADATSVIGGPWTPTPELLKLPPLEPVATDRSSETSSDLNNLAQLSIIASEQMSADVGASSLPLAATAP
ncbi:uncharacterized protein BJ171DRAFT_476133 [Polychytrium aggregatum]|uniref:uncharacterized protein n=1 Tax=Polychytrium aggregatum TaxID=110093 RepID=UPI0022FDEFA7|nr:uncharacterized protein BJ171DRAFT_476133 [Polychytrium aggregatum]KAI9203205.1 hypothetical protein BJ171DRAFT_476133 [Polychytrium aggregatum]